MQISLKGYQFNLKVVFVVELSRRYGATGCAGRGGSFIYHMKPNLVHEIMEVAGLFQPMRSRQYCSPTIIDVGSGDGGLVCQMAACCTLIISLTPSLSIHPACSVVLSRDGIWHLVERRAVSPS